MPQHIEEYSLWTVPLRITQLQTQTDLNRSLAEIILQRENDVRAGTPTTVAGLSEGMTTHWQEYNVLNWPEVACQSFRELLLAEIRSYLAKLSDARNMPLNIAAVACWANILRPGQSLQIHHHDPTFLLGNYCVQTGYDESELAHNGSENSIEKQQPGYTIYYRPGFIERSQDGLWDSEWRQAVRPIAGQLVICPGFIRHEVRPYMGSTQRISLGIDCYVEQQSALIYFGGPRWHVPEKNL